MFVKNDAGKKVRSYALLDGGSNRHVVSKKLCAKLGIKGEEKRMSVATLENSIESVREISDVTVEGVNGVEINLSNAIFGNIIAAEGDAPPRDEDVTEYEHLSGVELPRFPEKSASEVDDEDDVRIGVIIGAEEARIWALGERRVGPRDAPIGVKSALGWGLLGPKID